LPRLPLVMRELLEQVDASPEPRPGLVFLAAQAVAIEDDDLRPARRRAMLLLAAGGDPHRDRPRLAGAS
jgi:hypothetical protein